MNPSNVLISGMNYANKVESEIPFFEYGDPTIHESGWACNERSAGSISSETDGYSWENTCAQSDGYSAYAAHMG